MTQAALYVMGAALTVAYVSFISYSGGEDKWQRLALGAILLSMLLFGIREAMELFSGDALYPSYVEGGEEALREEVIKEGFETGIVRLVAEELSCEKELVRVNTAGFCAESVSAEKITVYLYGEAALGDYRRIKDILLCEGFGECEVVLSFEKNES